jgi:hypothetical protein
MNYHDDLTTAKHPAINAGLLRVKKTGDRAGK